MVVKNVLMEVDGVEKEKSENLHIKVIIVRNRYDANLVLVSLACGQEMKANYFVYSR